jgi:hypothetical protein
VEAFQALLLFVGKETQRHTQRVTDLVVFLKTREWERGQEEQEDIGRGRGSSSGSALVLLPGVLTTSFRFGFTLGF